MNKLFKVFGIVAAIVVVLTVALVILAKVLITPERVKQTVLPLAEQNLHRKVELADIQVSLFSGIELHDLKIYEPDAADLFVAADLVRLKYQLLPLLSLRVVIDEVRVEKPRIRVVRLVDGRFNFSDIADTGTATSGQAGAEQPAASSSGASSPINLLVSQVRLEGGELLFFDHVLNDRAPYRFDIKNLNVAADGITLSGAVPVKIGCNLNGGSFALVGNVNLLQPGGDFDITLQDVDVLMFKPYFEGQFPGRLGRMKLDVQTKVSGSPETVAAKGQLVLSDLDLVLDALADAPIEHGKISIDHDLSFDLGQGRLQLTHLAADINGLSVAANGTLTRLYTTPLVDLDVNVPGLDLRQAMNSLPSGLIKQAGDFDPAGTVQAQAKLSGGIDQPLQMLKQATIDLTKVSASVAGFRPALDGRLLLTGDQFKSEALKLRMGDNAADINLAAHNLYGKPIVATADLSAERFLLDPLLQGGAGAAASTAPAAQQTGAGPVPPKSAQTGPAEELGPFDIPAQVSGTVRIGETLYKGLPIKDFIAEYQLEDNVLTVSRMDGKIADGSFSNSARVDLRQKGLIYSADLNLQAIQADPLLTAFVPKAAGALLGAMDLNLAVSGRGTQWQALSKKLDGKGDMRLMDGRITSPALVNGFADILQISDLKQVTFDNFQGTVKITNGKLNLDSRLLSKQLKLLPKGTIGLDGSLDLSLDTRLSPEISGRLDRKGKVTQYLQDQEGWSQVPLLLTGTFDAPRYGLDPKAVKAQATKAITREIEGQIDKLFKKKQPAETDGGQDTTTEPAEDPAQKLLKDSLKKLFGD